MTTVPFLPTVLDAAHVAAVHRVLLDDIAGVTNAVLWHDAGSMAGVLTIAAGHALGAHAHRNNHHHLWVVEGTAVIADAVLGPGSYVHVPAGVEHDIAASEGAACSVFYVYEQPV